MHSRCHSSVYIWLYRHAGKTLMCIRMDRKKYFFCVRKLPSQLRMTLLYSILYEHIKSNRHINNLSSYLKCLEAWMIGLKDVVSSQGLAECFCQNEKMKTDISTAPYTSALYQHVNSKKIFFRESKFLQNAKVIKKVQRF